MRMPESKFEASKFVPKFMSKLVSILIALTAVVGTMATAHAATDAKQLFEQQERWSGGGQ